jgi:hypothetical protein
MNRHAVLRATLGVSADKRVDTFVALIASGTDGESRASKLVFDDQGTAVYVARAPGRYVLSWHIEGEEGSFVDLRLIDEGRDGQLVVHLDKTKTKVSSRGSRYAYLYFQVQP